MSNVSLEKFKPNIGVFGVGGAGLNAVNSMIFSQLDGVNFIVANTDAQSLSHSLAKNKIQLGIKATKGLGAGANPEIGKIAAEESINEIRDSLKGLDMVFITSGLGGGTGTGAAPIVAKEAKNLGILTIAIVTKPFEFEGEKRTQIANKGLLELEKYVDTLIIILNENLIKLSKKETGFMQSFKMADDVLLNTVKSVTEILTQPGFINRDLSDVKSAMSSMGRAMIGYGEEDGDDRHVKIVSKVCHNEILENNSIEGATNVLINITGNEKMTIFEVQHIVGEIRKKIDKDADIIFGTVFDSGVEGIKVTIICTGMKEKKAFFRKKDSFDSYNEYKTLTENDFEMEMIETQNLSLKKYHTDELAVDYTDVICSGVMGNGENFEENLNQNSLLKHNENTFDEKVKIEKNMFATKPSRKLNIEFDDIENEFLQQEDETETEVLYQILRNEYKKENIDNKNLEENEVIENKKIIQMPSGIEKIKLFNLIKNYNFKETEIVNKDSFIENIALANLSLLDSNSLSKDNINNALTKNETNNETSVSKNKADKQKMPLFDSIYSNLIKNFKEEAVEFIKGPEAKVETVDKVA